MNSKWPIKKLGEVAEIFNGKTPSKSEQRLSGLPILKIRDIDENGSFRGFQSFVDEQFYNRHKSRKIKEGDTLILNAAHNSDYVGSKNFFATDRVDNVIATGEWTIVRPSNFIEPFLLYLLLNLDKTRKAIKEIVRGIHLYPKDLNLIKVFIPPISIQKKIVERLDAIRKAQELCEEQIQKTEELFESLLINEFKNQKE